MQPLDEIVRRQVDNLDIVGKIDDGIRHGLAHADTCNLRDDVVQAFDVLDIQRRINVDPAFEKLLDVEITLRVAAALRIGMGKLVDQHQLGPALQDGIEIHFLERAPLVIDMSARNDLEAVKQGLRLAAAMGFDDADDDIHAIRDLRLAGHQHLVSLADSGRRTEKNLQPPARLGQRPFEKGIGRRSAWYVAAVVCHRWIGFPGKAETAAAASTPSTY